MSCVRSEQTMFNLSIGFSDLHFFAHHRNIPTLGYGAGGEPNTVPTSTPK